MVAKFWSKWGDGTLGGQLLLKHRKGLIPFIIITKKRVCNNE